VSDEGVLKRQSILTYGQYVSTLYLHIFATYIQHA
jgi:hypothetical protein